MSLRQLVALKRSALQSRIDALTARELDLTRQIDAFERQGDGLSIGPVETGLFQIAAMASARARAAGDRLKRERQDISDRKREIVRERLALDIADKKLEKAELSEARLMASRADFKG